jgi:hypothetical protein
MSARQYLSWVRRGAAAGIVTEDPLSSVIAQAPAMRPHLILEVDGRSVAPVEGPELPLLGPGQVLGFDRTLVTRVQPANGSCNGLANELAYIEFSYAELPWLFTPAAPNQSQHQRLRPWMVLVVTRVGAWESFDEAARPLPVVELATSELPNLADSWAWAHAQVKATDDAGALAALAAGAHETRARLLCPRRLEPEQEFRAFVVPAFEGGRRAGLAGLGVPPPDADLRPAWNAAANTKVALPVYYTWTFRTGPREGFEDVARKLKRAPLADLPGFGTREVDVRRPWPNLRPLATLAGENTAAPQSIAQDGALKLTGSLVAGSLSEACRAKFEALLEEQLNFPSTVGATASTDPEHRCVTAPIYGCRFQGAATLPPTAGWTRDLNLDMRRRIAASYGARYVQEQQEFLMARAWEQLPDIERANRLRRFAELAAVSADALHRRHIAKLTATELIAVAAPARTRTLAAAGVTLQQQVMASPLPNGAATPAFTRATRPGGRIARGFATVAATNIVKRGLAGEVGISRVTTLDRRLAISAVAQAMPAGATLSRAVASSALVASTEQRSLAIGLATLQRTADARGAAASSTLLRASSFVQRFGPSLTAEVIRAQPVTAIATELAASDRAITALDALEVFRQFRVEEAGQSFVPRTVTASAPLAGTPLAAGLLRDALVSSMLPSKLIVKRLADRIFVPPSMEPVDPLGRVMAGPQFPAPLALPLFQKRPDLLLPGLGSFPPNSVTLLETNPSFIEALLVGANHEMNRELLWREFPTDQRGTPFRHFWPRAGGAPEIGAINTWTKPLGENLAGGIGEQIVLLVRGEVLQRFPGTIVFAAPAVPDAASPQGLTLGVERALAPEFALRLSADTSIYGFKLTEAKVRGVGAQPGWFFVFQEPLTTPTFGFDLKSAQSPAFNSWNDLTWDLVPMDRDRFAFAGGNRSPPQNVAAPLWNRTAADIANITAQRTFRLAFHANVLLRE